MAKTEKTFPVDYSQRIAVVQALRKAFERVKHHQAWSGRLKKAFQTVLPEYTISIGVGEYAGALHNVRVWGNGLHYEDCVYVCFNAGKVWQEGFSEELEIADCSDAAERQTQEVKLLPELEQIEAQIRALRAKAEALFTALPVPTSATIRKAEHFWSDASYALKGKYPNIWPPRS
jgi:hypothetical protein